VLLLIAIARSLGTSTKDPLQRLVALAADHVRARISCLETSQSGLWVFDQENLDSSTDASRFASSFVLPPLRLGSEWIFSSCRNGLFFGIFLHSSSSVRSFYDPCLFLQVLVRLDHSNLHSLKAGWAAIAYFDPCAMNVPGSNWLRELQRLNNHRRVAHWTTMFLFYFRWLFRLRDSFWRGCCGRSE